MQNISKQIENLLLIHSNNCKILWILSDFTLNWEEINKLFTSHENLDDPLTCLKSKRAIDPAILCSHNTIINNKEQFLKILQICSVWTNSTAEILRIFENLCKHPEQYALTGFLQLTAILEFSLGNVYQTNFNHYPPHLLKDLLKELKACHLFDPNQIFILQILLGTSKGVNLRNLAWHGFVEAIDPSYLSFLFVIIVSYGKQLGSWSGRSKFQKSVKFSTELGIEKEAFENILSSNVIQNCNLEAWKTVIDFYRTKHFIDGVYLILSQIENLLRFIYGQINEISVKAELNKYYIIMDSIFYGYILSNDITPLAIGKITKIQELEIRKTHKRNKLLEFFPRSIFYIHYDLFYAADGPRLRDKISHGEVSIDDKIAETIFQALLQFTVLITNFYDNRVFNDNFKYDSKYMSNLIFYNEFIKINSLVENTFERLEIPSALKTGTELNFQRISFDITKDDNSIHFRPLIETQIVKLMLNIMETLACSIENFQESSSDLFNLYEQRKLSTSRRNMLTNLISFLPNFIKSFHAILNLLIKIFSTVQKLDDKFEDNDWSKKIIKMLKQTLQLTQVYSKHFSIDDRNYFIANSKTCEFLSQIIDNNQHMFEEGKQQIH